jgi:hypothetical protein
VTAVSKRTRQFVAYALVFMAVDLGIFYVSYFLYGIIVARYPLRDSFVGALYEIIWRLLFSQAPLQFLFLLLVARLSGGYGFVATVASAVSAFFVAGIISFSTMHSVLRLFALPSRQGLGEGFVLLVTVSIAWLVTKPLRDRAVAAKAA